MRQRGQWYNNGRTWKKSVLTARESVNIPAIFRARSALREYMSICSADSFYSSGDVHEVQSPCGRCPVSRNAKVNPTVKAHHHVVGMSILTGGL